MPFLSFEFIVSLPYFDVDCGPESEEFAVLGSNARICCVEEGIFCLLTDGQCDYLRVFLEVLIVVYQDLSSADEDYL